MREGAPVIKLMECPIAGFQFHGGASCWGHIRPRDRLVLRREPGNRHDPRAITVEWNDVVLGYVPREANFTLSQMMDRGASAEARVKSLREGSDPWQRVMMEINVTPGPAARIQEAKELAEEPLVLAPGTALVIPPAKLARNFRGLSPGQRDLGAAVVNDCVKEIARRLALPLLGTCKGARREIRLWETLAIENADGRHLGARFLEAPASVAPPALTLDLKRPLGAEGWIACFTPEIAAICGWHGLTKAELPEPLRRWIGESLGLTFGGAVDLEALRKAALAFLAPDSLGRSLANRIFGASPAAEAFNWVCGRLPAIALCGIEQPAMLPFLRLAHDDTAMKTASDPLATLRKRLADEGLEASAWRKLPRWEFATFAALSANWLRPFTVAHFANLLHRLDVEDVPPDFPRLALVAALHRLPQDGKRDFDRHPLWFMRAVLRLAEEPTGAQIHALCDEVEGCVDWLLDTHPTPDANQQRAGWSWVLDQAQAHREARALARAAPWSVPVAEIAWPTYRMVAIDCIAALLAEAKAMKNCLANYEDACRSGEVVVFSIRERATDARVACFAVERTSKGWELVEVAGKMNASVGEEIERIAEATVGKLNGGVAAVVADEAPGGALPGIRDG